MLVVCQVVASIVSWRRPRWVKSLSTCGAWVVMFLSRKSCTLTISYNFCPSGKYSIQQLVLKARSQFDSQRAIAEGEIVCWVVASIVPWWRLRWIMSKSTCGAWAIVLLSIKSYALTISYSFWPNGKCSIQHSSPSRLITIENTRTRFKMTSFFD